MIFIEKESDIYEDLKEEKKRKKQKDDILYEQRQSARKAVESYIEERKDKKNENANKQIQKDIDDFFNPISSNGINDVNANIRYHKEIKATYRPKLSHNSPTIRDIKKKTKETLRDKDDRTATVAGAIVAVDKSIKFYNGVRINTPKVYKKMIRVSKGVYSVNGKVVRLAKKVDYTYGRLLSGHSQINREAFQRIKEITKNKIINSNPIVNIKNTYNLAKAEIKYIASSTKYFYHATRVKYIKAVRTTKRLLDGTATIHISKATLKKYTIKSLNLTYKGTVKVTKYTVKGTVKLGIPTVKKTYKVSKKVLNKASDFLVQQNDASLQALGTGIKTVKYSKKVIKTTSKTVYKTSNTTVRTAKGVGKTAIKSGKGIVNIAKMTRASGVRNTASFYSKKASKSLAKAGGSAVNAISKALFDVGKKFIMNALIPIIVILVMIIACTSFMASCGGAVYQVLFGWTCTDKDSGKDIDETQWLTTKITASRNQLVNDVKSTVHKNLKGNGGKYDYVRFFNSLNDTEIALTDVNVLSNIYSTTDYLQYIQPIFHSFLLSRYELEPTESQMNELYNEIWTKLTKIVTKELPIEYCNGGSTDADGNIHADISSCPNHSEITYHTDDINSPYSSCDYEYYICNGHMGDLICGFQEHKHIESCYGGHLICTIPEHTHTLGCENQYHEFDCGFVEHTHSRACYNGDLTCTTPEHTHSAWQSKDNAGCYSTNFCSDSPMSSECENSTKHKGCNGYYICNGHKILSVKIQLGTFNDLLNTYFLNEINELENEPSLNEDEQKRLNELKDNYEVVKESIILLQEALGQSTTVIKLDDIALNSLTEFACSFIGNPYVLGGNDPNTGTDCSGFVKYVYAKFGADLPRKANEQVGRGKDVDGISNAVAGDLIFWSENNTDDGVYHVALYLGNGKLVHASNENPYPIGGIKVSNVYGTIYKIKRLSE